MSTTDGLSKENAIMITASDHQEGVAQEYSYLNSKFGERNKDWKLLQQALVQDDLKEGGLLLELVKRLCFSWIS